MSYAGILALSVHDKVFHLALAKDDDNPYRAHAPAFALANKEQERFRKCLEMCLVNDVACQIAMEKISRCRDPDKVVDTALGCFEKVFHRRGRRFI